MNAQEIKELSSSYMEIWNAGEEDWQNLLQTLLAYSPQAAIVLENDVFSENKKSLKQLQEKLKAYDDL